jgi:exosortase
MPSTSTKFSINTINRRSNLRDPNKQTAPVAITIVLLAACYASTLKGMFDQWMTDEDMSHGALVPLVVLWIVWRERKRWQRLPLEPSAWGFALLLAGAAMHLAGVLGVGLFASSVALLISAAGAVVCLGGFGLLRFWAFPFLLALFMLPKLAIVYNQVTLPLQLVASKLAAAILTTSGIGVIREGNILDVNGHRVAVAEACNGIRFLLPLGFVAVLFAYMADPKPWIRVAMLAATVPLAIVSNAFRVAASAWKPALDSGTPHQVLGWVIFTLTLGMLLPLRGLFNSLHGKYNAQ